MKSRILRSSTAWYLVGVESAARISALVDLWEEYQIQVSSPVMHSLTSFASDDNWRFSISQPDQLPFRRSTCLTHLELTVRYFTDYIHLLRQLGAQLISLTVRLLYLLDDHLDKVSRLGAVCSFSSFEHFHRNDFFQLSCPRLRKFSSIVYRNLRYFEQTILPLLQRLSSLGYLQLCLVIEIGPRATTHFIDGLDLQRGITSYIPRLRHFDFHIHTTLRYVPHHLTDFRSLSSTCSLEYFSKRRGQCHVFSLTFLGNRLDPLSNRFPLFELPRLTTLILHDIHLDYAEQVPCRSHLPSRVKLVIRHTPLLTVAAQDHRQAWENCSNLRRLRTPSSST